MSEADDFAKRLKDSHAPTADEITWDSTLPRPTLTAKPVSRTDYPPNATAKDLVITDQADEIARLLEEIQIIRETVNWERAMRSEALTMLHEATRERDTLRDTLQRLVTAVERK